MDQSKRVSDGAVLSHWLDPLSAPAICNRRSQDMTWWHFQVYLAPVARRRECSLACPRSYLGESRVLASLTSYLPHLVSTGDTRSCTTGTYRNVLMVT